LQIYGSSSRIFVVLADEKTIDYLFDGGRSHLTSAPLQLPTSNFQHPTLLLLLSLSPLFKG
jgi:hypothetical protein